MKARIHNANVDVEIEEDTQQDIIEQFIRDYPREKDNAIQIEWIDVENE